MIVLVGGIIPDEDIAPLRAAGVEGHFRTRHQHRDIVAFIHERTAEPVPPEFTQLPP